MTAPRVLRLTAAVSCALGTAVAATWRFLSGVLGADAYPKYREHLVAAGCDECPMTSAEFWRDRADRQSRQPGERCC
jgi:uncharacterized short protein YbdD (DUF466 family)